jgi:hypothetical protein
MKWRRAMFIQVLQSNAKSVQMRIQGVRPAYNASNNWMAKDLSNMAVNDPIKQTYSISSTEALDSIFVEPF